MNKIKIYTYSLLALILVFSCRKSEYIVEPSDIVISDNGVGTGTVTWEKGKEYILEGKVFVNDGQILTIEAGAVIRARQGAGAASSALIVARGGQIIAEGTAVDPIIFTCEGDDLEGSIDVDERGLWGGVIVLGAASVNTANGEDHVEGISTSEPRSIYGGNNDQDNSGILKYVSIRHSGTDLGQDNEINGLTLAGVGSKTVIENIEVISSADDGIEIFGGTVNLSNIIVANCSDDAIDIDQGYQGNGQFWCLLQNENFGDKLIEITGNEETKNALPYTIPTIYNITGVGRGQELTNKTIAFTDNAGGIIANSIFIEQGKGIELDYSEARHNSYTQWSEENLKIKSCIFHNINGNERVNMFGLKPQNDEDVTNLQSNLNAYFLTSNNIIANPNFETNDLGISLVSSEAIITDNYDEVPANSFYSSVNYIGAFDDYNWVGEWTLTYQEGIIW